MTQCRVAIRCLRNVVPVIHRAVLFTEQSDRPWRVSVGVGLSPPLLLALPPHRLTRRVLRPRSRRTMSRYPSCLISWTQSGREGGWAALEGWQGGPSGGIDVTRDWLDPYTGEIHTGIVPPTTQQQVDKAFGQGGIAAALDLARMAGEAGESQVQAIYDLKNTSAGTAAKIANIQELIGYERCLPSTLAREQKVADLQQSIMDLQKSTDTLNRTNQRTNRELLSPYYTMDPRTNRTSGSARRTIAAGGYVDVPGGYFRQ